MINLWTFLYRVIIYITRIICTLQQKFLARRSVIGHLGQFNQVIGVVMAINLPAPQRIYLTEALDGKHPEFLESCLAKVIDLCKQPGFSSAFADGDARKSAQAMALTLMRTAADTGQLQC